MNRKNVALILVGMVTMSLCASVLSQDWVPSRYGADDRIGAANNLSSDIVLQAARLITTGKVYSLGVETAEDSPAYGSRTFTIDIIASGANVPVGADVLTTHDERVTTSFGIGSQIDGLGHLGIGHQYYNGLTSEQIVADGGLVELGTHTIPPIVTRGVLLDMARHFGVDMVSEGTAFNRAQIEAAASAQGLQIRSGTWCCFTPAGCNCWARITSALSQVSQALVWRVQSTLPTLGWWLLVRIHRRWRSFLLKIRSARLRCTRPCWQRKVFMFWRI